MTSIHDSSNDAVMAQYYEDFRKFIYTPNEEFYNRRKQASANKAQKKLLRLSLVQFYELTTDVHDEMNRRLANPPAGDFLPPLESLHPKRNQARKKLYMLQDPRFKDLVFDMLYEIERRRAPNEWSYDSADSGADGQPLDPISTGIATSTPATTGAPNGDGMYNSNENTSEMNNFDSGQANAQDTRSLSNRPTPPSIVIPNSNANDINNSIHANSLESPLKSPGNTLLQTSMLTPTKSTLVEDTDDDETSEVSDDNSFNNPHAHPMDIPNSSSTWTSPDVAANSKEPPSRSITHDDFSGTHNKIPPPSYERQPNHPHQSNYNQAADGISGPGNHDDDLDGFQAQLRDKDEQIQLLIGEGTRLDENITKLEEQLAESESLKDTLVEENGRLHEMIGHAELAKDQALAELEAKKREFTAQSDNYLNEIESQQRALANLQIQHEQLKEKYQAILGDKDGAGKIAAVAAAGAGVGAIAGAAANSGLPAANDPPQSRLTALEKLLTEKELQISSLQEELHQERERTMVLNGGASSSSSLALEHTGLDFKTNMAGAGAGAAASTMSRSISAINASHPEAEFREKYKQMEQELKAHQKMTENVRSEAAEFLKEMRALVDSQPTWSSERAAKQIDALKIEIEEWKKRYTQSKAEIRSLRASTYGLNPDTLYYGNNYKIADNTTILSEHGLVADVDVAAFQLAVDEFVLASRDTDKSAQQIKYLHSVVQVTKVLTQEIAAAPSAELKHLDPDVEQLQREITQATGLVSAAANSLITSTRNFVVAGGMSSLFLLDAVAADLSAAVIELVKLVKVRPTMAPPPPLPAKSSLPPSQQQQQQSQTKNLNHKPLPPTHPNEASDAIVTENGEDFVILPRELPSGNMNSNNNLNGGEDDSHLKPGDTRSIDFDKFSPSLTNRNRYGSYIRDPQNIKFDLQNLADNTVIELQEYLENETAGVIDAIQGLLTGIKGTANYRTLRSNITNITDSVRTMIEATSGMMTQSKHWQLKEHGAYIVDSLENCCQRMKVLYGDSAIYDETAIPDKNFKQRLAGISFDMAKCTTELVKTVEEVNLKLEINDIEERLR
jgi:hypothetical protein